MLSLVHFFSWLSPLRDFVPKTVQWVMTSASRPDSPLFLKAAVHSPPLSPKIIVQGSLHGSQARVLPTHRATLQEHPTAAAYGVPLKWEDLRHLVLSSAVAREAALRVASPVDCQTSSSPQKHACFIISSFESSGVSPFPIRGFRAS